MVKIAPLLFFLLSTAAAADCVVNSNGKTLTIKDSSTVSLHARRRSLATHQIQDQGDVGFCYANATSVVLKSVLPKHPDLSYVHAALEAGTRAPGKNWAVGSDYVSKPKGSTKEVSFVEVGNVCDTISALKSAGGACLKSSSMIETMKKFNPDLQKKIFMKLGRYFDRFKEAMYDPKANPEKMKNEIAFLIEEVKDQRAELIRACKEEKREIPLERALRVVIEEELLKLKVGDKCDDERREKLRKFVSPASKFSKDVTIVYLKPEVAQKLAASLANDKVLSLQLQAYAMEKEHSEEYKNKLANLVAPKITSLFDEILPKNDSSICPMAPVLKMKPSDIGKIVVHQVSRARQNTCEALVKVSEAISLLKDENECSEKLGLNVALDALGPLLAVSEEIDASKLVNPNPSYGDQMKKILTPGCEDKNNLISLKNISCETRLTCGTKCANKEIVKEEFKTAVFDGVSEGRATGLIFCTGVLKDPTVRTGFCKKPVKGVEGHGMHVVAVSGYRCQAGQIEYEVTNSWGSTCPIKGGKLKNSAIDCVLDSKGKPTGRFFMTEDALVDNMTDFNIVKNVKKP